jgi:hypothetical protein
MNAVAPTSLPTPSLASLSSVVLDDYHRALLGVAEKVCGGPPACRQRKLAEARELLALAQISDRLVVHWLDLSADLRAKVELRVPVACLPDPNGPLQVAPRALLGIIYPEKAAILPQPGFAFVRILAPGPVWHSNVSHDPNQVLCLGTSLPAGVPLKEIILMTYGALSLQTTQLDRQDPAGVLNPAAGDWWQHNPSLIPLTREPFLQKEANHAR